MVEIRNYTPKDFKDIKELLKLRSLNKEKPINEKALERKITANPDSILVAIEGNRIVGTQFIVEDYLPILYRLAVHPDFIGKGIGKDLTHYAEKLLRKKGYDHANVLIASDDTELQEYFEREGYDQGSKFHWMVKDL